MKMDEKNRKCFKCGKSPAKDNVKLHRFPKPGTRNILRCTLWAKYIFPSGEYASAALQRKLYTEHRMLCGDHFDPNDFTDSTKKRLTWTACPRDAVNMPIPEIPTPHSTSHHSVVEPLSSLSKSSLSAVEAQPGPSKCSLSAVEPQPGPSKRSLSTMEPQPGPSKCSFSALEPRPGPLKRSLSAMEPQPGPSSSKKQRTPLTDITNIQQQHIPTQITIIKEKCFKYMKQVCKLQHRIKKLKNSEMLLKLTEENCIKKLSKNLTPTFALLLQAQIKNQKRKAKGRRWSKEQKITALRLYKRSPTCYRLLRRLFFLPSPGTLKALLNRVPLNVGVVIQVLQVIKKFTQSNRKSDNEFTLMWDEMSIKKHLEYNVKEDRIEGYQDHGEQGRCSAIATYALVFMIAGIRKNVKQPIAHYFSSGFSTADRLAVLIKKVLHHCFSTGINISATVCDMDGVNRRALSILGAKLQRPYITWEDTNKEIVTIFDTPHLLKCFRNLFLKYDIQCPTNISSGTTTGMGTAKWSHIKEFFEEDNKNLNFVFAPGLTKEHLNPNPKQKMKVKLAAQVLSHTVAAGLYAKISNGVLTTEAAITANVVSNMDKLFDSLNSDTADLRRGKAYATNLSKDTPHFSFFSEMKTFFSNMKFVGCPRQPPSQEGWIWTITAVERLFNNLMSTHNVKSLATRRLQQDPLENLFGCIRGNCGSNTNPTTGQFVAGFKTAILSRLAHIGTKGNCEADNNVVISNFEMLLSVPQGTERVPHSPGEFTTELIESDVIENNLNTDSAEMQACAYVCGFLLKSLSLSCDTCKNIYIATSANRQHLFVECKEYSDYKSSLNYATSEMITFVETSASIINNYLEKNGHYENLKKKIVGNIKQLVNSDFMKKCVVHFEQNLDKIINNIFFICVKRFCIKRNREFSEEASASALRRKMSIIMHK